MFELPRTALGPEGLEGRAGRGGRREAAPHGTQELPGVVEVARIEEVLSTPDASQGGIGGEAVIDR